jgi:16S rRNA (guanine(1405)-N(7))-methyltransferase
VTARDGPAERVAATVVSAPRYRDLDPDLVRRVAVEEVARSRDERDAVKRVKRRLHQATGAYRAARVGHVAAGAGERLREAVTAVAGDRERLLPICRGLLATHASTRERLPYLDRFYPALWRAVGGAPSSLLDLGCGLGPLALPWMDLAPTAPFVAVDADAAQLETVGSFLGAMGQAHETVLLDLGAPSAPERLPRADVALLLKLVPLLDRQRPDAAARLLRGLRVRHAVVSFPMRSLGGRARGMEGTYRRRMARLAGELGPRVTGLAEASVPNELAFVLTLSGSAATDG